MISRPLTITQPPGASGCDEPLLIAFAISIKYPSLFSIKVGSPVTNMSQIGCVIPILGSKLPLCDYIIMDYYHFLEEFDTYNEWNQLRKKEEESWEEFKEREHPYGKSEEIRPMSFPKFQTNLRALSKKDNRPVLREKDDRVISPSHYTSGKREVIDTIEDAVKDAPSTIYGMLQGQVLKYILRVWLKDNPVEDMKKARWYLDRLINHYENPPGD